MTVLLKYIYTFFVILVLASQMAVAGRWPTYPEPSDEGGDCFTSSFAILLAQADPDRNDDTYIICPGTTIDVGLPNEQFTDFTLDWPLVAIKPGVTIKCGYNGARSNNCVLNGGFIQFITFPRLPDVPPFNGASVETHDLRVQGITFSGELTLLGTPSGPLASMGVALNAPGENMVFEDCAFVDWSGWFGFFVGELDNLSGSSIPGNSIDVTLRRSLFQDVEYVVEVIGDDNDGKSQSITVDWCGFKNIKLRDASLFDNLPQANIMECHDGSTCRIERSCFQNVEYGSALLSSISVGEPTTFTYSNLYEDPSDGTRTLLDSDASLLCTKGLGISTVPGNNEYEECVDVVDAKYCPLMPVSGSTGTGKGKGKKGNGGKGGKGSKGGKGKGGKGGSGGTVIVVVESEDVESEEVASEDVVSEEECSDCGQDDIEDESEETEPQSSDAKKGKGKGKGGKRGRLRE